MIDGQEQHSDEQDKTVDHEYDQLGLVEHNPQPSHHVGLLIPQVLLVPNHEHDVHALNQEYRCAVDQGDKGPVIVQPDAIAQPRAMVVEAQDAIVAERTMLRPGRPEYHAGRAELLPHNHAAVRVARARVRQQQESLVRAAGGVVQRVTVFEVWDHISPGRDPWVHEGCEKKRYHYRHGENDLHTLDDVEIWKLGQDLVPVEDAWE
mmetsp:Transcript_8720/g.24601  ORF Transcript_8720/g.24601 Transcript_8720/m.24601 type:complete len:206 (-) Transcript_8720:351-968(-)